MALLLALLALLPALACAGQSPAGGGEPGLKAAYVFNFLRFAEWRPAPATAVAAIGVGASARGLMLCVPADSPLLPALRGYDGHAVNGRTLTVASYTGALPPARLCQAVLRATGSDTAPLPTLPNTLTIADGGGPVRTGAVITLVRVGRDLAFDIDTAAADAAGIELSSQLLKLARSVR